MFKLLLIFFLLVTSYAKNLEILSGEIDVDGQITTARGDVLVFYEDMLIASKYLKYDKAEKTLDLKGDVYILQGVLTYIIGEHIHFDLKNDSRDFSPFFMHDKYRQTWVSSKTASATKGVISLKAATLSTCNPSNPDWRIAFSSGTYYEKEKWLNLFNMRLYAGTVPIFYFPYIGLPTDTSRHSGVLTPDVGYTELDGYSWDQAYFFALAKNMDLELRYQYRTERGMGAFSEFRFVDTATSKGSLRMGGFRDFDKYAQKFSLKNQVHYGAEFDYTRQHLLDGFAKESTDALFADINLYNDIDYVSLQEKTSTAATASAIVTSRVNYNWTNQGHYLGLYAKYFIDTSKATNDATLQEIPKIQYHKFIDTLFLDNLIYSMDVTNIYRARPLLADATETAISMPIVYTLPLFNEYLYLSMAENFSVSNIHFSGLNYVKDPTLFIDGFNASASSTYAVGTDLTKKYRSGVHSLQFSGSLIRPLYENRTGFYSNANGEFDDEDCQVGEACEFAQGSINPIIDTYRLSFTQYLFDNNGKQLFYHKINQSIKDDGNLSFGTLENDIVVDWGKVRAQNDIFISFDTKKVKKMVSSLGYNTKKFTSGLTHFYQNQPEINKESNYFTLSSELKIGSRYKVHANYAYDALLQQSKNWSLGLNFRKRCWGYQISYLEQITPILVDSGVSSYTDRSIYVKIELIPIGGFDVHQSLYQSTGS